MELSLEPVSVARGGRRDARPHPAAGRRSAASRCIPAPDGPSARTQEYVMADRQRFKQVLLNLLSNAVKYNRPRRQRCGSSTSRERERPAAPERVRHRHAASRRTSSTRLFVAFDRLGRGELRGAGHGPGPGAFQAADRGDGRRHRRAKACVGRGHDLLDRTAPRARARCRPRAARGSPGSARRPTMDAARPRAHGPLHRGQPLQPDADRAPAGRPSRDPADDRHAGRPGPGTGPAAQPGPDPARPPPARHARLGSARALAGRRRHARHPGGRRQRRRHARARSSG